MKPLERPAGHKDVLLLLRTNQCAGARHALPATPMIDSKTIDSILYFVWPKLPPTPWSPNKNHIDCGIGHCRFNCGPMTRSHDRPRLAHGPRKGAAAEGHRALFWTDVEAIGVRPIYHSCSPSRDTARADAFLASARRTEGVGLEHGPFFCWFCAVPRYDSSEC